MQHLEKIFFIVCTILALSACVQTPTYQDSRTTTPIVQTASWAQEWWQPRHEEKILQSKNSQVDLLMLGDSITQLWESDGLAVWQEYFQEMNAFNLGFSGDRTEHVLWRLDNGAVDFMSPKLCVLMIGTNNTGHNMDSAEDTTAGIQAILTRLQEKLPKTKVLLLAIFPRGKNPDDPMRLRNEEINHHIQKLTDNKHVHFLNINHVFTKEGGELKQSLMPDFLHPLESGFQLWAEAMYPTIEQLMNPRP